MLGSFLVALTLCVGVATAQSAVCWLSGTQYQTGAAGFLRFEQRSDGNLQVTVSASGLSTGSHGYHVHTYGDITNTDGSSPGGHFIGNCDECRPDGQPQEVGLLDNGVPLSASASGDVTFEYVETVAKLTGPNSILGRSVVIHGVAGNSGTRAAQCVIGRETEDATAPMERPTATQATCLLKPTTAGGSAGGKVTFTQSTNTVMTGVWVTYDVTGLSPGAHGFHVHQWGNISSSSATAVGGHFFGDCDNCRPGIAAPANDEVGSLFDNIGITASAGGSQMTMRFDGVVTLGGINSIIGRSLVVHGVAGNSGTRVAQCVIGEAAVVTPTNCGFAGWEAWTPATCDSTKTQTRSRSVVTQASNGGLPCKDTTETRPCGVDAAICEFEATSNSAVPVQGRVTFTEQLDTNLTVTVDITSGLTNGDHGWHVHTYGDISNSDGTSVGGHFVGTCDGCRPAGQPQEAGLLDNGVPLTAVNGALSYTYTETVAKLSGPNSILGRGVIIHGDGVSSGTRVAQCVIGRASSISTTSPVSRPQVTQASCRLTGTYNNPTPASGVVTFTSASDGVWVSYDVSGISPGTHGFHVHQWGNVQSTDATGVAGHFIGNCVNCRPGAALQEVGYLFDGVGMAADSASLAVAQRKDSIIELKPGDDRNIVGRSLVVHDVTDSTIRVAQCVIGEAAVVSPTSCQYSTYASAEICVCSSATACTLRETRSVTQNPKNGGTPCDSSTLDVTASCPAPAHQSSSRVAVALTLEGLLPSQLTPFLTATTMHTGLAETLQVLPEAIVNTKAVPTTSAGGTTLQFDVLTTSPSVVTTRAEQVFGGSTSSVFRTYAQSVTGASISSVTLDSTTTEDAPSDDDGGLSDVEKAGISIAVILGVAMVGLGIALYCKRSGGGGTAGSYGSSATSADAVLPGAPVKLGRHLEDDGL